MASHGSLSHGWVISNKILRWMAWAFMVIAIVIFITVFTITYTIRRDCYSPYNRNIKMFGYWLHVEAGSTKDNCPDGP